jgi:hypothetical protein
MVATRRIFPEGAVEAPFGWAWLERLGEEVSLPLFRRDLVQAFYATPLDRLVSKALADVKVLSSCPLPAAEDVSRPVDSDAGRLVLEHLRVVLLRESRVGEEVAEVHHFDGHLRD